MCSRHFPRPDCLQRPATGGAPFDEHTDQQQRCRDEQRPTRPRRRCWGGFQHKLFRGRRARGDRRCPAGRGVRRLDVIVLAGDRPGQNRLGLSGEVVIDDVGDGVQVLARIKALLSS